MSSYSERGYGEARPVRHSGFSVDASQRGGAGEEGRLERLARYATRAALTGAATAAEEDLLAFSCKTRELCPSCAAKRSAAMATLLADDVLEEVGHAQWVFVIPKMLRPYFLHRRGGPISRPRHHP